MKLAMSAITIAAALAGCTNYPAPSTAQASPQPAAITKHTAAAKQSPVFVSPAPAAWASGTDRMAD